MEAKLNTNLERIKIYFARASNENYNGLVRYFINKRTDINTILTTKKGRFLITFLLNNYF